VDAVRNVRHTTWGANKSMSPATMAMHLLICKPKRTKVHNHMPH